MKQSNENHPLQLRLQGKIPCRCYSTALWDDTRAASGEEGEHTNSRSSSSSMAVLHPTHRWCSESCACLTAAPHLAGAPGPEGSHPGTPGLAWEQLQCCVSLSSLLWGPLLVLQPAGSPGLWGQAGDPSSF